MSKLRSVVLRSGLLRAEIQAPGSAVLNTAEATTGGSLMDLLQKAMNTPLGLPPMDECAVGGDRVVVVLDPETPELCVLLTKVIEQLELIGNGGVAIRLLLPSDPLAEKWQRLLTVLPEHVKKNLAIDIHDPADETQRGYLASSASGERIYMNRHLLDADLIVMISRVGFDSLLGYRGTCSTLFPAFSDAATIRETRLQGHPELTPEQKRPMRDLVDEIGWLLGTQFSIQIVPAADGGIAEIVAGLPRDVQQASEEKLNASWQIQLSHFADVAAISVPADPVYGWKWLGNAVEAASKIVRQGGRLAVIADLSTPDSSGLNALRRSQEPEELIKPLRKEPTEDAVEVLQLIQAMRRIRLYLLSSLPSEVVEEFGMIPLTSSAELQKLIDSGKQTALIAGANFAWCSVNEEDLDEDSDDE